MSLTVSMDSIGWDLVHNMKISCLLPLVKPNHILGVAIKTMYLVYNR